MELSIDLPLDVLHQAVVKLQIGQIVRGIFFYFGKVIKFTILSFLLALELPRLLQFFKDIQEVRSSMS